MHTPINLNYEIKNLTNPDFSIKIEGLRAAIYVKCGMQENHPNDTIALEDGYGYIVPQATQDRMLAALASIA